MDGRFCLFQLFQFLKRLRSRDRRWEDIPASIREEMQDMVAMLNEKRESLAQARALEEAGRAQRERDPLDERVVFRVIRPDEFTGADVVGESSNSSQDLTPPPTRGILGRLRNLFRRRK